MTPHAESGGSGVRPLAREILVSGTACRVQIAADRIALNAKGRSKGAIEITWDELLAWRAHDMDAHLR